MIEWKFCSRCGKPCSIQPLSKIFDPEMKKYGGVWYCEICNKYYSSHFLSYAEIKDLTEKQTSLEHLEDKEKIL